MAEEQSTFVPFDLRDGHAVRKLTTCGLLARLHDKVLAGRVV